MIVNRRKLARREILDAQTDSEAIALALQWNFGKDGSLLGIRRDALKERLFDGINNRS